jgi:type III secretory pathway component EscU
MKKSKFDVALYVLFFIFLLGVFGSELVSVAENQLDLLIPVCASLVMLLPFIGVALRKRR